MARTSAVTIVCTLALAVLLGAGPAAAADGDLGRLKEIERALEAVRERQAAAERDAGALEQDIAALRAQLVEKARAAQRQEEIVGELEKRLGAARAEARSYERTIEERRGTLVTTLGALTRLARRPTESLVAAPAVPLDTLRSALLLRAIVPHLETEARRLGTELRVLQGLNQEITAERSRLAEAQATLARERAQLDRMVAQKGDMLASVLSAAQRETRRLEKLAAEAEDMRGLLARLSREAPTPLPRPSGLDATIGRSFAAARGALLPPARGRIAVRYGDATATGLQARGITVETRPGARVVAPFEGRIVYAGHFRSYGQLLIIAHSEGYHTLIAGFSRIDGVVGQTVLAGEPVGQMADAAGSKPALYVEMRHDGAPFDPLPWLSAHEREVSG